MARLAHTLSADEKERLLVRIAWACEVEGLDQASAAKRFSITRLRVNKALAEARKRGIVRVTIYSKYAVCAELEASLIQKYRLTDAHIVPASKNPSFVQTNVGAALGYALPNILAQPKNQLIGMSWGNTLNLALRHMAPINCPHLEIVTVMGGQTRGSDLNSYEITQKLAKLCNAQHSYFTAPIYASSAKSRGILLEQDVFKQVINKIRSTDVLVMAAGDMSKSLLVKDCLPPEFSVNELVEAGAVGDLLGYMVNEAGKLIDHPINNRLVGIKLKDLKAIPNVILAAGGQHKVGIMRAALKLGYLNTLITDEETAKTLL